MEFYNIVKTAFFCGDNAPRTQAEQQILMFKDQNIDQFFILCAQGLQDANLDIYLRQACGTLIKRCVSVKNNNNVASWLILVPQVKKLVKDTCLGLLVSPDMLIKRAAANAISEICAIELPRNEWPEIINTLVQNVKSTHPEIAKSAVITLGYIAESLKFNKDQVIGDQEQQKILYGICLGLGEPNTDLEIKKISIKALQDALTFMYQQFQKKECLSYVCNLLIGAANCNERILRIAALQCFIDVMKQLYDVIVDHLPSILQVTLSSLEIDDVEIAVPAMEIWTVFGVEVAERIQSQEQSQMHINSPQKIFLINNLKSLVNPFLQNLFKNDSSDEEDSGGLTIQESAYRALSAITEVVGSTAHDWLTQFINQNIGLPEWINRKAAVLAFGALAETTENPQARTLIFAALSPFVKMLQDQNIGVRVATARVLSKVAEHYPECYFQHNEQQHHLILIFQALDSRPVICKNIVWLLTFLTENLSKWDNTSYIVTNKLQILQYLASTAVREGFDQTQYSIIDTCFMGILNVMYSIDNPQQCKEFLGEFHQRLIETEKYEIQRKIHIQSGLLTAMHGCLMRLQPENLTDQEIQEIFTTFFKFCSHQDFSSDGLYAMSGLASCLKKKFSPMAQTVLNLLNTYLQSVESQDTFKTSLYCLADIARGLEDDFVKYLGVLDYLIGLINNPSFDRDMKIQVYICIADIILGTREKSLIYIEKLINLLKLGFQGCMSLSKSEDPQSLDYADRLKEQLMSYYTCMLHAYVDGSKTHPMLFDTLDWLVAFAETTCDKKLKPTVEYIRLSLNAILDAGNFFNQIPGQEQRVKKYLTSQFLINLIQTIGKYKNQPENQESYNYATELLKQQFGYNVSVY